MVLSQNEFEAKPRVIKRIVIYLLITFVLTWGYWFLVSYPIAQNVQEGMSSQVLQLSIAPAMLFPALSVVLTRLITREGFKNVHILPLSFRKTWKYWLAGWFAPALFVNGWKSFYRSYAYRHCGRTTFHCGSSNSCVGAFEARKSRKTINENKGLKRNTPL